MSPIHKRFGARVAGEVAAPLLMATTAAGAHRDLPEPAATTAHQDGGGLRICRSHQSAPVIE